MKMTSLEQLCYTHQLLYKQCLRKSDHWLQTGYIYMTSHPNSFPVLVRATVASHLVIGAYQGLFLCNLRLFPFPGLPWNPPCGCTSACGPTQPGSLYTLDHEVDEIRALELCKATVGVGWLLLPSGCHLHTRPHGLQGSQMSWVSSLYQFPMYF